MQLFGLFDASEFTPRGIACFYRTHAAANVFLHEHLHMRPKFGVKISVQVPLAEKAAQTRAENTEPLHVSLLPYRRAGVP